MSRNKINLVLGVLLVIVSVSGIPSLTKTIIAGITGLTLVIVAVVTHLQRKSSVSMVNESGAPVYVENSSSLTH